MSSGGTSVEHITDVKWINTQNNAVVESTVAAIVAWLKQNYEFHVVRDGYNILVTHATSSLGREYIKTRPDSTLKDNLLSLPRF